MRITNEQQYNNKIITVTDDNKKQDKDKSKRATIQ